MSDKNYWIVGAMFGGDDDNLDDFLIRGYWYCWDRNTPHNIPSGGQGNSVEAQQSRLLQIKAGDRIAVKKIKSITNQEIIYPAAPSTIPNETIPAENTTTSNTTTIASYV